MKFRASSKEYILCEFLLCLCERHFEVKIEKESFF